MKIQAARQLYNTQLDSLWNKKQQLTKLLDQPDAGQNFDRVEISKELDSVTEQYEQTQSIISAINQKESMIRDTEATRQSCENAAKAAEEIAKCMEIARRIASGGKVPAYDEQKLMEFSYEIYQMAKQMASMRQQEGKEYDSLWDDEGSDEEPASPEEIAANSEINTGALAAECSAGESVGAAEECPAL